MLALALLPKLRAFSEGKMIDVAFRDKSLTLSVIPVRLSGLSARAGFRKQKF